MPIDSILAVTCVLITTLCLVTYHGAPTSTPRGIKDVRSTPPWSQIPPLWRRKWHWRQTHDKEPYVVRVAVLRPFSPQQVPILTQSFESWNEFAPCSISDGSNRSGTGSDDPLHPTNIQYDLFLSYSQSYNTSDTADKATRYLIDNFESFPWSRCFRSISRLQIFIPPEEDLYQPAESDTNLMWVHGPNRQFVRSMEIIQNMTLSDESHCQRDGGCDEKQHLYSYALLIENDVQPIRSYWLDNMMEEAHQRGNFAILGSKYVGLGWRDFRSSLPLALQHHINGNALYNMRHPLFRFLLWQLKVEEEELTVYHAVPYDYRMSQILVEGFLGVEPDLPSQILTEWKKGKKEQISLTDHNGVENPKINARGLPSQTEEFRAIWGKYGTVNGEATVKESKVIKNYAGSNLLPRDLEEMDASLIHGAQIFAGWETFQYNITLVVSEWHDELASHLLAQITESSHPFSNAHVIIPRDLQPQTIQNLASIESGIPLTLHKRGNDVFDLCNSDMLRDMKRDHQEWLMITNSYHVVSERVDLLFDKSGRPLIHATIATLENCFMYAECRHIVANAKMLFRIKPDDRDDSDKEIRLVRDFDMVYHRETLEAFCEIWVDAIYRENDMEKREYLSSVGVLASAYVEYLDAANILEGIYQLSSVPGRKHFQRLVTLEEEEAATFGETAVANRILKQRPGIFVSRGRLNRRLDDVVPAPTFNKAPSPSPPSQTPPTPEQPTPPSPVDIEDPAGPKDGNDNEPGTSSSSKMRLVVTPAFVLTVWLCR